MAARAPGSSRWRSVLRVAGWAVFAAWSLLLAAWLTLHWGILPRLDEWRPSLERVASRALGLQVEVGRIEVSSSGWVPAFALFDVVLRDTRGREALRLPRVAAALSVHSLLAMQLQFDQLLIDGPRLEVRRDRQGRMHVAGLDLQGETGGDDGVLADWFFEQHEFVIRDGVLRWVDELRGAPPLELAEVQVVVRNRLGRHDLRIDATPPPSWGRRFTLMAQARQPLLGRSGDWQRWRGTLHADLPQVLVSDLRHRIDLPIEIGEGEGALRAWIDFDHGLPQGGTIDLALRNVSARLGTGLEPLAIARVSGRLVVQRTPEAVRIEATGFGFETAQGQQWPEGRMVLGWRQPQVLRRADLAGAGDSRPVRGGEFSADRLDLGLMAGLAERLPIGVDVRRLLAELEPQGTVWGLAAKWEGALDALASYEVQANVKGMAIRPAPAPHAGGVGRPGWQGADLSFTARESGGRATLKIDDGALEFPGVFDEQRVPLRRFATEMNWQIERGVEPHPPRIELKIAGARFANDDAEGEFDARWHTGVGEGFGRGARLPGVLELAGKLGRGSAAQVARYLPLGVPQSARDYVRRAVRSGRVETAQFRVQGDLWDFPFVQREAGEFHIAGQVRDVTLAYVPSVPVTPGEPAWESPWPAFEGLSGELVFDRTSMRIRRAHGRLWGIELHDVDGSIADLTHATLAIDGRARGPASDLLRYVSVTPVGRWLGGALEAATAEGRAELTLALELPLGRLDDAKVRGSVQLSGGDVRIQPGTPVLSGARGRVDFTRRGVQIAGSARAFGGEASFDGGTQADGSLRFQASGIATAEGLRRSAELGPLVRWAVRGDGQAPYRLQLGIVHGHLEIAVASPLTGLALELPPPLGKPAATALPLRVQTQLMPASRAAGGPREDMLRIDLGSVLSAQYLRDVSGERTRVLRGAVAVGRPLPEMTPRVAAVATLDAINVDAWLAALPASGAQGALPDDGYLPRTVELEANALTIASRRLDRVRLGVSRAGAGWNARIDAEQLAGEIGYVEPRAGDDAGRVRARLARLSIPQAGTDAVESWLDEDPTRVPALDLEVEDFELRGRKLGRLSVSAVNRSAGDVASESEWRLDRLMLSAPEGELFARGQWATVAAGQARRRMDLDVDLRIGDGGAMLERFGFGRTIRGGKGRLQGRVSWAGSPLSLDLPTLDGQVNLALDAGQFLKVEPGASRLLGVLSLQALPRRLALDFRDVFEEGFAFDSIGGDVQIGRGVARTNNLRMRGVQAAVLMEGSADLARETQDLRVVVVPEINAYTASLAYAVINPAIGLGTFLGQLLLHGPLVEAGTREFRVTGSWADPQIAQVQRSPRSPSAAASAASAPALGPASGPARKP